MRAFLGSLLALGFVAGCSDPSLPAPSSSSSKTAPADPKAAPPAAAADNKPLVVEEKAVAVIDAAIKAHGGAEALAKAGVFERSIKGNQILYEKETPFTAETSVHLPDRYRDVIALDVGGQKIFITAVINGEHGWQSTGGATMPLPQERLKELGEEIYVWSAERLLPLKSKDVGLSLLPEGKAADKPAAVVKVNAKGKPELKLYFDKASGLLVKIERRATLAGQPMEKEYLFLEHKSYDGAKLPARVVESGNGKKLADWTVTSYKFPAKFDGAKFAKP